MTNTFILNAFQKNSNCTIDIANKFADCFESNINNIVPNCNVKLIDKSIYAFNDNVSCRYRQTSAKTVHKEIKSLTNRKAPGIDGIRAQDLKVIDAEFAEIIAHFINTSMKQCKYPNELKTGIVRPIFKNERHDVCDNYQPISILSNVDKIVEKAVSKQIHSFIKSTTLTLISNM